jgi:GntR family transcriptional regulator / MocR family aminotransferase
MRFDNLRQIRTDHYDGGMRDAPAAVSPIIPIDRDSGVPLHKQIYDGYRSAILRGDLRAGQQVTSSRVFAAELRVSRFPVLNAYAQLLAEGYFESRVGAGTFVSASLPEQLMSAPRPESAPAQEPSGPRPMAKRAFQVPAFRLRVTATGWGAFGVHQPAFDQFPFQVWSSLVARHSQSPQANAIHHIDPRGLQRFREEICNYLRTARAVKCDADQIMVVSGSQQALDITARVLFDPGNRVWIEEPGYSLERAVLTAAGCELCPVPVDTDGMDVAEGIRRYRKARAAFVTPSHQYPLGATMSASRRLQLLNWAQSSGAWVIEDDYDSEFRYESQPVAALQGLDANARVIYIGTFSKVLFASLRIGYIVVPRDLMERFMAVRFAMDIFPPYLYQEVLTDFMKQGHFGRHIRRMRQLYGERRAVLVESLREQFGDSIELHGAVAGMHLAISFPHGVEDREIVERAAQERLWLLALTPTYLGEPARQGFILGFGSTPVEQIPRAVARLKALVSGTGAVVVSRAS